MDVRGNYVSKIGILGIEMYFCTFIFVNSIRRYSSILERKEREMIS